MRRPTGLSASAETSPARRPTQRFKPRATLYSPPPSETEKVRVVATRPSPGSRRSITSPRAIRSYRHSRAGRSSRMLMARRLASPRRGPLVRAARPGRSGRTGIRGRAGARGCSWRGGSRRRGAAPDLVEAPGGDQGFVAEPAAAAGDHGGQLEVLADGAGADAPGRDEPQAGIGRRDRAQEGGAAEGRHRED